MRFMTLALVIGLILVLTFALGYCFGRVDAHLSHALALIDSLRKEPLDFGRVDVHLSRARELIASLREEMP